ncbi:MAG: FAD:protein FMN transferase [Verrucomicrobiales bacterium]|nr:FAD:protein FMN transferase [Verrucomicrobiales bacterium]
MNNANRELHDPSARVYRHQAMATWFEIHIVDDDADFSRRAATEAFRLLDHLEYLLSRYREESEVSIISRLQPGEVFAANDEVMACLSLALQMSQRTMGAFDPALGREIDRHKGIKSTHATKRGRLILDPVTGRISCEEASVTLDLGAIGKGFALDRMAELLEEWGVGQALLVAGGSSVRTLTTNRSSVPYWSNSLSDGGKIWLKNAALGCSGVAVQGAHIINPVTRKPADCPDRVWVVAKTAAEADAFSTAFMILSKAEVLEIAGRENLSVACQPRGKKVVQWLIPLDEFLHKAYFEKSIN